MNAALLCRIRAVQERRFEHCLCSSLLVTNDGKSVVCLLLAIREVMGLLVTRERRENLETEPFQYVCYDILKHTI